MKFMLTYSIEPVHSRAAIARFLESGAPPPASIKMQGRWHAGTHGYILIEASDAKGVFEWISQWSDLLKFTTDPVVEDSEAGQILQGLKVS
ncbi:MAG: DUF3303 family protein [Bryobacterales bacterium]